MKIKVEKKYIHLGVTVFLTAIAIMAAYLLFFRLDEIKSGFQKFNGIMRPFYYGMIMAYVLTPLLNWIEKKFLYPLFDKYKWLKNDIKRDKHIRGLGVLFTFLFVALLLYIFFANLIPQVYTSIQSIIKNYNHYTENLSNWLNAVMDKHPEIAEIITRNIDDYSSEADDFLNDAVLPMISNLLVPNLSEFLTNISSSIVKVGKVLYSAIVGLIIALYLLSGKEKFAQGATKITYAVLETPNANRFLESIRYTHHTFIGFLSGKIVDSAIIGVICYICALFMKLPYPVLIAVIVGVTNIIPFFGPYFGAVPSAIIILMVNPMKALYFIIMILILQQFDGNFLGPKILSESTGLSSFWIIFAITLFGGYLGVFGMVIGVPITAVIFNGINKLLNGKLIKKELPTETEKYYEVGEVSETGEFTHYVYEKKKKEPNKNSKFYKFFILLGEKISKLFKNIIAKFKSPDKKTNTHKTNNKGRKKS